MAHDDRYRGDHRRPETQWRGEPRFGAGWGNQQPRPQRLGDRDWRGPSDDPDAGAERYGAAPSAGFASDRYGPMTSDPDSIFGAPGYDAGFAGPRFDRADVGSVGTHGVHPVSTSFGAGFGSAAGFGPGSGYASSARRYAAIRQHRHDPHYSEWRRREIDRLDRDYHDYRREHQARFDEEFGAWRSRRDEQRRAVGTVREHMEVVGSDGAHVGTVDCTRGEHIVLTKSDENAGGVHHAIPCGWVEEVGDKVVLNLTAEEAMNRWREGERSRALFEREDSGSPGPHMLNRSFSGTYDEE